MPIPFREMNLVSHLDRWAETMPDVPAIIDVHRGEERILSFRDLGLRSRKVAGLFTQAGLKAGDSVLIFQPMSAELYIIFSALLRAGLVAMFIDPSSGRKHIEQSCNLHPPRGFIGPVKSHVLRLVSPGLRRIPVKFSTDRKMPGAVSLKKAELMKPVKKIFAAGYETPALITFTSGTTGTPKIALRTHGFLAAQHKVLEDSIHLKPGQTDLATLPIFVLANLASGVTSLIPSGDLRRPAQINPHPIIDQIQRHRPCRGSATPTFFDRLIGNGSSYSHVFASFTRLYTGGAPVYPRLLERLQRVAPNADIVTVYGSTEAEPIAEFSRKNITESDLIAIRNGKGLLAGKPVSGIEVKILKNEWGKTIEPFDTAEFETACLPTESVGEIVVSGNHVLPGYLNGIGDEETKFKAGDTVWHRTGDTGYFDSRRNLWLLGRCSARIEDEYGVLYPFGIEAAACEHPEIHRAAALSLHARRVLVVEGKPTISADALTALKSDLKWAHLHEIRILKRIPVDSRHQGKVNYSALRKLLISD